MTEFGFLTDQEVWERIVCQRFKINKEQLKQYENQHLL